MDKKRATFARIDLLRELATIGSGRAATSLADMISTKVQITVPDTRVYPSQKLKDLFLDNALKYFVLDATMEGELSGKEYLLLSEEETKMLAALLLGMNKDDINLLDEMTQSSLREVANILLSSYMNALSDLTGVPIIVGVPNLSVNQTPSDVDSFISKSMSPDREVLYVKSHLCIKDMNFDGLIFYVPDDTTLDKIFDKMGIIY